MIELRQLGVKLRNLVIRAVVDRPGRSYQVKHLGDRVASGVQMLQPQGLHFQAPAGAQGLLMSPVGELSSAVLVAAQGTLPTATLEPGEGGLHLLGTYKVYLDSGGKVHLGGGTAGSDFVALAAKVEAQLNVLKAAIGDATVTAGDGGAAFKSSLVSALSTWPASVAAVNVKAT